MIEVRRHTTQAHNVRGGALVPHPDPLHPVGRTVTSCLLASRHSGPPRPPSPLCPGLVWPVGPRGQFLIEPGSCAFGGNGRQDTGDQLILPPSTGQCGGHGVTPADAASTLRGCPEPTSPLLLGLAFPPSQAKSTECWEHCEAGGPGSPPGQGRKVPIGIKPPHSTMQSPSWPLSPILRPHLPYPASGTTGLSTPRHLPSLASNLGPS